MPRKGSEPFITRLEPLRPRGLNMRVHLDQGEPLEVALEALERLRLGVGDPLPPKRRHLLLDADAEVKVREAALSILSYRARTRAELKRKLLGKGFHLARVEPCLDRLEQRGLLDDEAVASAFVRDRIRLRPRGKIRLTQELRAKGVGQDVATRVVDDVLDQEEITEADLVRQVVSGWLSRQGAATVHALGAGERTPASEKARRRLHGYLARRGFGGPALGRAMEIVRETLRA
jgi:regulatory protein